MNATLLAAIESVYDAAKASPEKQASDRVTVAGHLLKIRVQAAMDSGQFGGQVQITITDRTV